MKKIMTKFMAMIPINDPLKLAKLAAFVMFITTCMTSLCLGTLVFVFVTGDLPFGINPMMVVDEAPLAMPEDQDVRVRPVFRKGEEYILKLYNMLEDEREKVATEREKVAAEKALVKEIETEIKKLQKKVDDSEEQINKLLDTITRQEKSNIKRLSDLLAGTETGAAAQMLLEMEPDMAARILYTMDTKKSAELLSVMPGQQVEKASEKVEALLMKMHRLKEEKNGDSN